MKCVRVGSANAEYIGRGSIYGNPFVIGPDGERMVVIAKFKAYAEWRLSKEPEWLEPLRGKDLACYCAPQACHGDVIIALLQAKPDPVLEYARREGK